MNKDWKESCLHRNTFSWISQTCKTNQLIEFDCGKINSGKKGENTDSEESAAGQSERFMRITFKAKEKQGTYFIGQIVTFVQSTGDRSVKDLC